MLALFAFSLALHPDKEQVATGQVGKSPQILVWHSTSLNTTSIMKGGHTDGVGILVFDKSGEVNSNRIAFSFSFLSFTHPFFCLNGSRDWRRVASIRIRRLSSGTGKKAAFWPNRVAIKSACLTCSLVRFKRTV